MTLSPPFDLVLGHPEIPSPISKAGSFPQNSGFLSVLQAVWNRAVLCSHSTWLKNVRNVELYFPPPSLPAFSFLTLLSGEVGSFPRNSLALQSVFGGSGLTVLQGVGSPSGCVWSVSHLKQSLTPTPLQSLSSVPFSATFQTETGREGQKLSSVNGD